MKGWNFVNRTVSTTAVEVCAVNTLKDTARLLIVVPAMKNYELVTQGLHAKRCIVLTVLKCDAHPGVVSYSGDGYFK
jgi:hypothetical protein